MDIWAALKYVTSPLTLIAFLAAAVSWVYVTQLKRIESLIRAARPEDRKVLVEGALDVLRVPVANLPAEQRFELALRLVEGRRFKVKAALAIFALVALALTALTIVAFINQRPDSSLKVLLSENSRGETLRVLKEYKIFRYDDAEMPNELGRAVILDKTAAASLNLEQRIAHKEKLISAVPSIVALREKAKKYEPPFERLGELASGGVPRVSDDQPRRFLVHVPIGSDLANQRVALVNPQNGKELRLIARAAIDDTRRDVDIHINGEQAKFLFEGSLPASSVKILVFPMQVGNLYDPTCPPTRNSRQNPDCAKAENIASQDIRQR